MSLTAAVEVPPGQTDARAFTVTLRITNPTDQSITILNPDMGIPSAALNWPYSKEAYQTWLLMSFRYLSISVTDEAGNEVPRQELTMSATPALRPPVELRPGESLAIMIPLGAFYELGSKKAYRVAIEYGDPPLKVSAQTRVVVS